VSAENTTSKWDCDLLIAGSGAGALSTAVTAGHLGLKVIVVEKDPQLGGTTAWSGGLDVDTAQPLGLAGRNRGAD
jgi:succinate dehydrogenase/fumarate reductase flavoprotein subunit